MKGTLLVVAVVFLAALAISLSWQKPAVARQPTDDDVIEQLRLAGSNLSKPHPIDFYIYLPTKDAAQRVANALGAKRFRVEVKPPAASAGWLTLASKEIVPTSSTLSQLRREMTSLAKSEHGEYDGWEAAVVK
jgi:Regulator of ribonuclease activity B